jgi:hypothetical protein
MFANELLGPADGNVVRRGACCWCLVLDILMGVQVHSIMNGRRGCVSYLLSQYLSDQPCKIADVTGRTALDYAVLARDDESVAAILSRLGAPAPDRVWRMSDIGFTSGHLAAEVRLAFAWPARRLSFQLAS